MSVKAGIIRGLIRIKGFLPLRYHYFQSGIISWIMGKLLRYRRDSVIVNLSRSFPELRPWEIRDIANDFYRHLGEIIAEAIWFGGRKNLAQVRDAGIIRITNPEDLQKMYDASPGVMMMATHCGNWEMTAGIVCQTQDDPTSCLHYENVAVIYKQLSSKTWNEVITSNREAPLGGDYESQIESKNALRYTLRQLHDGRKMIYVYINDQCPYTARKSIGNFLHQPTVATMGAAELACKTGMSVMYQKFRRLQRGKYEITFIPICEDASKTTPEAVMRKYYDLLQQEIEETPANWLWSHHRWKELLKDIK